MPRRRLSRLVVCLLSLALLPASALALELQSIQFPERRSVNLRFAELQGAPRASIGAEVVFRDGQAQINVSYESMKPAILFAGDVTCYVLWAVTRDGIAENLGELLVDQPKGKYEFTTGKKNFALLVTAEPFYLVSRPSALVMFRNGPSSDKRAPATVFDFDGFAPAPKHAMDSIANIAWDADTPLTLLQARKAYELAKRNDAKTHASQIFLEAGEALSRADQLEKKAPNSRRLLDDARRAVALSNEAINISLRRIEGIELEKQIAKRRAEMAALEARAAEAEQHAATAKDEVVAARAEMDALRAEKKRMASETKALTQEKAALEGAMVDLRQEKVALEQAREKLQRDKRELSGRLQEALSHVAETRDSARGFVVNLPDILFDVNQATLKPDARVALAKLAGILLIVRDLKVTVEGHTDSTGSEAYNLDLSRRRAEAVQEFMGGEGVADGRLSAVGFGMTRPVADNATAQGRSQNRRVEIIIEES